MKTQFCMINGIVINIHHIDSIAIETVICPYGWFNIHSKTIYQVRAKLISGATLKLAGFDTEELAKVALLKFYREVDDYSEYRGTKEILIFKEEN